MSKPKYNLEIRKEIATKYVDGMTTFELADMYEVGHATISNYLKALDVEMRTPGGTLTPSKVAEIAAAYDEIGTSTKVAKMFGVSHRTVINAAKKHGVEIKNNTSHRTYDFNTDFFETWSPNMAYILGFIFADGSVHRNGISIYQKDPTILYEIRDIFGYTGPLHMTGTGRSIYTLMLHSREMVASLTKYNLTPGCKTYTASLPEKIEYPHDFIRGYFDGDGHGGWYGPKRKPVIGFTSGSEALLRDVINLIPFKMRGPYEGKGRSMSIATAGKDAFIRTRDWMYNTSSALWIDRKKIKLNSPK